MPTLHRLSVFRDDIIFIIFLYQRWIYRTDVNRTNEFGISGLDLQEMERRKQEKERTDAGLPQRPQPVQALVDGEERKEGPSAPLPSTEEVHSEREGEAQSELRRRKLATSTTAPLVVDW